MSSILLIGCLIIGLMPKLDLLNNYLFLGGKTDGVENCS